MLASRAGPQSFPGVDLTVVAGESEGSGKERHTFRQHEALWVTDEPKDTFPDPLLPALTDARTHTHTIQEPGHL